MAWISFSLIVCAGLLLSGGMFSWSVRAVRRGSWTNHYGVTVHRDRQPLGFWLPVITMPLLAIVVSVIVLIALAQAFSPGRA